jgi:hypothetical protein
MLEFIHEQYLLDPNRRWPWLAHAALLAKHRLRDLPLARRYAADIDRRTTAADVPLWAKQMEVFILEDMTSSKPPASSSADCLRAARCATRTRRASSARSWRNSSGAQARPGRDKVSVG